MSYTDSGMTSKNHPSVWSVFYDVPKNTYEEKETMKNFTDRFVGFGPDQTGNCKQNAGY